MFERRLKIFLALLGLFSLVLLARAGQVQVVQHDQWVSAAAETTKRTQLLDAVRGSILDRNGLVIATDTPSVDVCVDYRALSDPPDKKWLDLEASRRLRVRLGEDYTSLPKAKRLDMVKAEAAEVVKDINAMWGELARVSGRLPEQIAESRKAIIERVELRKEIALREGIKRAKRVRQEREETEAFWQQWLAEELAADKNDKSRYEMVVSEETESHVVLRAVDVDVQNELGKFPEKFPGLSLRASTHRTYPFGNAGCHLLGRLSQVNREDVRSANNPKEETRQYLPNDEIGRGGVEGLFEQALRGTRGKVERVPGRDKELSRTKPTPGQDVRLTIDIKLQAKIEAAIAGAVIEDKDGKPQPPTELHGAAVFIDVPTGEVLAMASYPTYDPNKFDEMYDALRTDDLNQPLLNRATMAQLQPGSTIKPVVGLSAISAGLLPADRGIECTGYLVLNGRRYGVGRCWVASMFKGKIPSVAHHPVPQSAAHPTGFLTFADALERSCNVYFETLADSMGLEGLSAWYERFGLGRPTGIGIAEARGRLPRSYVPTNQPTDKLYKTWFSGIGQDPVAATPIQMANAVTTIARNGVWRRPRLVSEAEAKRVGITLPTLGPAPKGLADEDDVAAEAAAAGGPPKPWPDVYDLQLNPEGLAAARFGMQQVVYGGAGTGKRVALNAPLLAGLRVAGKTGTAQAGRLGVRVRDPQTGEFLKGPNGKPVYEPLDPLDPNAPSWYRSIEGKELSHAWYVGFAPADNPKVAFAVMVEYGGSGGITAAAVARQGLSACVELGYLPGPPAHGSEKVDAGPIELLRDVRAGR